MKQQRLVTWFVCALVVLAVAAPAGAWHVYKFSQDGTAIPDVDKANMAAPNDNSCWQAAAANLLGAAGWGSGANAQAKANSIYKTMNTTFGIGACGNTGQATSWWLQNHGQDANSADYDPNNLYTNVTSVAKTLVCSDYKFLLDELNRCQYAAVLFTEPKHWMTLIGGDYEDDCNNPSNPPSKKSVWHDSDRDQGGVNDNPYFNDFTQNRWDLSDYTAIVADEYVTLCPGLNLDPTGMEAYWIGLHHDPRDSGGVLWMEAGDNADEFDDPYFEDPVTLVIDNEPIPDMYKKIQLLVDYADPNLLDPAAETMLLLDDMMAPHTPLMTVGPDNGQILYQWTLDYQPAEERIIFPGTDYEGLTGNVLGWQVSTECIPEPASATLLVIGFVTVFCRRKRK